MGPNRPFSSTLPMARAERNEQNKQGHRRQIEPVTNYEGERGGRSDQRRPESHGYVQEPVPLPEVRSAEMQVSWLSHGVLNEDALCVGRSADHRLL
jgi:hypothetical protein